MPESHLTLRLRERELRSEPRAIAFGIPSLRHSSFRWYPNKQNWVLLERSSDLEKRNMRDGLCCLLTHCWDSGHISFLQKYEGGYRPPLVSRHLHVFNYGVLRDVKQRCHLCSCKTEVRVVVSGLPSVSAVVRMRRRIVAPMRGGSAVSGAACSSPAGVRGPCTFWLKHFG